MSWDYYLVVNSFKKNLIKSCYTFKYILNFSKHGFIGSNRQTMHYILEHLTMAATSTARWGKKHASRWLSLPLYWTWKWGCQLPWENADLHTLFINMNYHKKSSTFWADNTDFNPMVNCVLILMPQNMVNQRQTN